MLTSITVVFSNAVEMRVFFDRTCFLILYCCHVGKLTKPSLRMNMIVFAVASFFEIGGRSLLP
ncbi:unnamed protein product [Penicillium roqueforti FM164]|uniref:Uncharacterized protein n=1 Tax=Penicillium roqueforti (strain FM164) TaxID=1365484 RepID=W6QLL2_PENRF|nr:unnamed protein product [Penicillium roqueforti FM164]